MQLKRKKSPAMAGVCVWNFSKEVKLVRALHRFASPMPYMIAVQYADRLCCIYCFALYSYFCCTLTGHDTWSLIFDSVFDIWYLELCIWFWSWIFFWQKAFEFF